MTKALWTWHHNAVTAGKLGDNVKGKASVSKKLTVSQWGYRWNLWQTHTKPGGVKCQERSEGSEADAILPGALSHGGYTNSLAPPSSEHLSMLPAQWSAETPLCRAWASTWVSYWCPGGLGWFQRMSFSGLPARLEVVHLWTWEKSVVRSSCITLTKYCKECNLKSWYGGWRDGFSG